VKSLRRSYDACRDASRKAETLHVPFPWGLSIQGDGGDCDCADDGLIGEDNKGIGEHESSLGEASDGDTTEPSNGDTPHRTTRGTPRDTTHSTTHTTNTFSDSKNTRLFGDLSHSKTNARSAARDARRAASIFLDTWREYLTALVGDNALRPHSITDVTGYEKITVLMKVSISQLQLPPTVCPYRTDTFPVTIRNPSSTCSARGIEISPKRSQKRSRSNNTRIGCLEVDLVVRSS
jgi:hypothetical protein